MSPSLAPQNSFCISPPASDTPRKGIYKKHNTRSQAKTPANNTRSRK
jgi:hypothetical protein